MTPDERVAGNPNTRSHTMKRALVLIAAALTACGGSQTLTAEEARNAMPGASQAQLGTPQNNNALTAATTTPTYVNAEYAVNTVKLTTTINLNIA